MRRWISELDAACVSCAFEIRSQHLVRGSSLEIVEAQVPCFSGDGFTCRPSKCTADTVYSSQLLDCEEAVEFEAALQFKV